MARLFVWNREWGHGLRLGRRKYEHEYKCRKHIVIDRKWELGEGRVLTWE